jgi:hypothetical protein
LTLRKFIDYYKSNFADKINDLAKKEKCIYIILVDKKKNIRKLGKTKNLRKRLQNYSTGRSKHPEIEFILHTDEIKAVERCSKLFTKANQIRERQELYKIGADKLKQIIFDCAILSKKVNGEDMSKYRKHDAFIAFDKGDELEYLDIKGEIVGYEKIV